MTGLKDETTMNGKLIITLLIAIAAAGCGQQETPVAQITPATAQTTQQGGAPASTPAAQTAQVADGSKNVITGAILETMNAGGYTYMKLRTAGGEVWAATPQVSVKKGETVTVHPQMTAEKFASTSLNRTFVSIVFATLDAPGDAPGGAPAAAAPMQASAMPATGAAPKMPASPQAQQMMMTAMGMPADHMKPKVDLGAINVPKAEGENAHTVSGLWASRAKLEGASVVVRGKVVKFLPDIMGTNFVHVRDGSGSEGSGDHDLTVTTNDVVTVGDIVTVRGTVHIEKDFGAGYKYPVIVENAKIVK